MATTLTPDGLKQLNAFAELHKLHFDSVRFEEYPEASGQVRFAMCLNGKPVAFTDTVHFELGRGDTATLSGIDGWLTPVIEAFPRETNPYPGGPNP